MHARSKHKRLDSSRWYPDLGQMPNHNQRYAFVTATPLDPKLGSGTAVAIMGLLGALNRRGKKIGLVTPPVLPLPDHTARWWFNRYVARTLHELDIDAAIGFDCDGYRFAGSKRKCTYAAYLHGVIGDEAKNERGRIRRRLTREANWERRNSRGADIVIVPSQYSKEMAMELYGLPEPRVVVLYNGIDIDDWPLQPEPSDEHPTVLCVAKMYPRKGINDLIKAWPKVHSAIPAARLRIVGDGQEEQRHIALAGSLFSDPSPITFLGAMRPPEVRQEYGRCHVFCLPSRQEAFGIVYVEAMASGRPAIGTTSSAIPEVIGDGGLTVPPRDPDALADALVDLLRDPELRSQYAARGRRIAEGLTWDIAAIKFGEMLANI